MNVELTKEWCMNMAKIEARATELHEGCQMPMEQARELAESEAGETKPAPNLELFAAFGAADGAKEQGLRGYYPMATRVLAEEVRRRKAGHDALKELTLRTGELIEHLQKTGRLAPCFNLPALDAARAALGA